MPACPSSQIKKVRPRELSSPVRVTLVGGRAGLRPATGMPSGQSHLALHFLTATSTSRGHLGIQSPHPGRGEGSASPYFLSVKCGSGLGETDEAASVCPSPYL